MVWLSTNGVAIYEKGVAISFSVSRAPCRSQKSFISGVFFGKNVCTSKGYGVEIEILKSGVFLAKMCAPVRGIVERVKL